MRCLEFENLLNEQLDERRTWRADAALVAHAAECGVCRRLAASYDALAVGLSRLDLPAPSTTVTIEHIVAAVHAPAVEGAPIVEATPGVEGPPSVDASPRFEGAATIEPAAARKRFGRWRTTRGWTYAAFAAAACLAVAATIGVLATPRGERAPGVEAMPRLAVDSAAAARLQERAREERAIVAPPADSLARQAAVSYLALARETNSSLASAFRAFPSVAQLDEPPAPVEVQRDAWVKDVASDFEPMARSAGGAIQSLFRAFDVRVEQAPRREVQS